MYRYLSIALVAVLALAAVACGGDDEDDNAPVTVANAETCEQLMDAFIPVMQDLLDAVSDMSMADLMSDEEPEFLADFEDRMDEIGDKSDELDCQDDELQELLMERADQLTASGAVGELFLEAIRDGSMFD